MSDPDDKPQAGPADSQSKSLFDSEWDALLGDAASSSPSKPIVPLQPSSPAPKPEAKAELEAKAVAESEAEAEPTREAKAEPKPESEAEPEPKPDPDAEPDEPAASLRVADSVPRNSTARASVSGAYVGPKPRPVPTTLPRYERPEGVSPYYDDPDEPYGDPEADTGDYGMAPRIEPAVIEASTMAATLGLGTASKDDDASESEDRAKVIELARARAPAPDDSASESASSSSMSGSGASASSVSSSGASRVSVDPSDDGGGSRGTLLVIGLLAIVGLVVVAVTQLGREDPDTSGVASKAEQPSGPPTAVDGGTRGNPGEARPTPIGPKPVEASDETGDEADDETGDEYGETGDETGGWQPKPQPKPSAVDPRDPSLIPPGTPEEHAKAFLKLPVSIHDGPPVGGIGSSGIHIDAISTSRGRENTECDNPTESFSLAIAKYVNVCFRVVHPRELESLRVIWEKDGKVTRRGRVRIPDLHAYTTRAYLLLRPEYVGDWRVRIVPEGEESVDLAVAEFVITE